ncbi:unnamed protein product, partial [Ascophyllum nodosum]
HEESRGTGSLRGAFETILDMCPMLSEAVDGRDSLRHFGTWSLGLACCLALSRLVAGTRWGDGENFICGRVLVGKNSNWLLRGSSHLKPLSRLNVKIHAPWWLIGRVLGHLYLFNLLYLQKRSV